MPTLYILELDSSVAKSANFQLFYTILSRKLKKNIDCLLSWLYGNILKNRN